MRKKPPAPIHVCPAKCHYCPFLDGQIMPYCMGQAARGADNFASCTCESPAHVRGWWSA